MDKVEQYEQIVIRLLNDYATAWEDPRQPIKTQVVLDRTSKHYQLIRLGWRNSEEYVHNCLFHLDIVEGKIWIQENRTDISMAEELVNEGVDKKDIVLGMLPHALREDSEYASA